MPTPTVPVTVTLVAQDGTPYVGVTVRARLDRNDVFEDGADGSVVIADQIEAVTDAAGVAILDCFPNAIAPDGLGTLGTVYTFRANIPGGRALNVQALVPNAACRLEDILTNVSAAEQEVLAAHTSAQAAAASAASAAASAASAAASSALILVGYAALRAFAGAETRVYISGYLVTVAPAGVSGMFIRDDVDLSSGDNGGSIIVDALGRRWKRVFEGDIQSKWWDPDGTVATDATSALQGSIDAAFRANVGCYINAGSFSITGLKVYDFSRVTFDPKAKLVMSADGFGIRTLPSPSSVQVTTNIRRVQLISPYVDMNGKNGVGILFEGVTTSFMSDPRVENIGTGTFNYNDGVDNMVGLPTMGIALKGVSGIQGAYYNDILRPRTFGGNVGLWMGTSTTTRTSKANHNTVHKPVCQNAAIGMMLHTADDNLVIQPDCSNSTVGLRVGVPGGGVATCNRNRIVNSYMEICTVGLDITTEAAATQLDGIQSVVGTATPYVDAGSGTMIFYPKRLGTAPQYARFYDKQVKYVESIEMIDGSGNSETFNVDTVTFSAIARGLTTAGVGAYNNQNGRARKHGTTCDFHFVCDWASHTGTGSLELAGLPFPAAGGTTCPVTIYVASGLTLTAGAQVVQGYIASGGTSITLTQYAGGSAGGINLPASAVLRVSGSYEVAA
jgi:hypothetical protein